MQPGPPAGGRAGEGAHPDALALTEGPADEGGGAAQGGLHARHAREDVQERRGPAHAGRH